MSETPSPQDNIPAEQAPQAETAPENNQVSEKHTAISGLRKMVAQFRVDRIDDKLGNFTVQEQGPLAGNEKQINVSRRAMRASQKQYRGSMRRAVVNSNLAQIYGEEGEDGKLVLTDRKARKEQRKNQKKITSNHQAAEEALHARKDDRKKLETKKAGLISKYGVTSKGSATPSASARTHEEEDEEKPKVKPLRALIPLTDQAAIVATEKLLETPDKPITKDALDTLLKNLTGYNDKLSEFTLTKLRQNLVIDSSGMPMKGTNLKNYTDNLKYGEQVDYRNSNTVEDSPETASDLNPEQQIDEPNTETNDQSQANEPQQEQRGDINEVEVEIVEETTGSSNENVASVDSVSQPEEEIYDIEIVEDTAEGASDSQEIDESIPGNDDANQIPETQPETSPSLPQEFLDSANQAIDQKIADSAKEAFLSRDQTAEIERSTAEQMVRETQQPLLESANLSEAEINHLVELAVQEILDQRRSSTS